MRTGKKYKVALNQEVKDKLLYWAQKFEEVIWMDSNSYSADKEIIESKYKAILAVDAFTSIKTDAYNGFGKLEEYQALTKDWLFGYLTYDLKNDLEDLSSKNFDGLHFPDLFFFQPKRIFLFSEDEVEIRYLRVVDDEIESDWQDILEGIPSEAHKIDLDSEKVKIHLRTSKDSYFSKLDALLKNIHRGDIYEANFCQEFFSEGTKIDPLKTYVHLNEISKAPFATFLKFDNFYALSASPERFISKIGNKVLSQPIKGTAKRSKQPLEDKELKERLAKDPKERSENIMITDLVRNDLSRIAEKGSVKVEELCKVYSFEQVHQMISTISCIVGFDKSPVEIIRNTFPMGSMTGAPKISAMKIIEDLEDAKRGLYSGAIGYFTPENNFDFNVVIRSILYNESRQYISYSVGGAITAKSIPESEYEECLIKAKAMREVLEN